MNKKYNNSKTNVARKKRPKFEITPQSTFDDYCKATYDPDRGFYGDKSEWSVDRQLKAAIKLGNDKWKESEHRFVPESEKRRNGRKGWSKARQRRKAQEEKLQAFEREKESDKEPDFKNTGTMPERRVCPSS